MRRWACRLQVLLALTSAEILGSESRGTHDHFLLSQARESPKLEDQVHVSESPRNRVARWPIYTPRHWIPFSSPPTTFRATVEVFESASTWDASTVIICSESHGRYGLYRKYRFQDLIYCYIFIRCRGIVFAAPLPSSCRIYSLKYSCFQLPCEYYKN
jgi:hypothetical protein